MFVIERNVEANNERTNYHYPLLDHMGTVSAANATSRAISDLAPRNLILVGIAGGIKGKIMLGDVVIPDNVTYYEMGKQETDSFLMRGRNETPDPLLFRRARNYVNTDWHNLVKGTCPQAGDRGIPEVKFGPVASGE